MPVSPAALLKQLIERRGEPQKAIALSWLDRWNATATRPLSITTVSPRLSNALSDQLDGWQFYFGTPQRAAILLDVLDATDAEREALLAGAAERLAGYGAARVVVDLHDLGRNSAAMLAAMDQTILTTLLPAVVLLTADQWARLPMAYSERVDELKLVKITSDDEALEEISARSNALVLSSRPPRNPATGAVCFSRWAALAWERGQLTMSPEDAVGRFVRDGALPELPAVERAHRLDALGIEAQEPVNTVVGPSLWRRLRALADGTLDAPAAARLGEARAYGIIGASTDDERVRAALAAAGLPTEEAVDAKALARAVARASLRPTPATVLHCEGAWHLLNAPTPAALVGHPRVHTHAAEAKTTALQRLAAAVAGRTATDWELDPLLEGAFLAVDPAGGEAAELKHARAWLILGGHCAVGPDVAVADPLGQLARLLAHPAPAAELRLTSSRSDNYHNNFVIVAPLSDPKTLTRDVWAQVPPVGQVVWLSRDAPLVIAWVGGNEKADGEQSAAYLYGFDHDMRAKNFQAQSIWEAMAALPTTCPLDDDAWLDAFEARGPVLPMDHLRRRHRLAKEQEAAARIAAAERAAAKSAARGHGVLHTPFGSSLGQRERTDGRRDGGDVRWSPLFIGTLAGPDWGELDVAVAIAWAALRGALDEQQPIQVHDGRWLLPITHGLLAELTLCRAPDQPRVRAGLGQTFDFDDRNGLRTKHGWTFQRVDAVDSTGATRGFVSSRLFDSVRSLEAHTPDGRTIQIGVKVPRTLHLLGEGVSCTVRFLPDPYGLSARPRREGARSALASVYAGAGAAVTAAAAVYREEAAQDD